MATLPTPGDDAGAWGDELNEWLLVGHDTDGTNLGGSSGVYAVLRETVAAGAFSGAFTAGSWVKRVLNDEYDPDGIVTLSSGVFTLPAGDYRLESKASAASCGFHQARIRDTTNNTTISTSSTHYLPTGVFVGGEVDFLSNEFTLAGSTNFELQHRCSDGKTQNGLGASDTSYNWGEVQVFAQVKIYLL
jgi:hypothetical protein